MKHALKIFIPLIVLLLVFNNCQSEKENTSDYIGENINKIDIISSSKEVKSNSEKEGSNQEILSLINSLETFDSEKSNRSAAQIIEIARNNSAEKVQITEHLISEIEEICNSGKIIYSEPLFRKIVAMSDILAELKSMQALDVLVNCSNNTRPAGTQAINEFATMRSIINYKEKALPTLEKKLSENYSDKYIKCRISSILSEIGGKEAENILKEAKKNELDEEVKKCLERSLNYLKRTKT